MWWKRVKYLDEHKKDNKFKNLSWYKDDIYLSPYVPYREVKEIKWLLILNHNDQILDTLNKGYELFKREREVVVTTLSFLKLKHF